MITHGPFFLTGTINVAAAPCCRYMCLERGKKRMHISELDFSFDFPKKGYYNYWILASCNGLLFSSFFIEGIADLDECYICNPWTKEFVRLPKPNCLIILYLDSPLKTTPQPSIRDTTMQPCTRFCLCVTLTQGRYLTNSRSMHLIKESWQLLERASKLHPCSKLDHNAIYCNGFLYWQCPEKEHVLMFNLETETSVYLHLPHDNDVLANSRHYLIKNHPDGCRLTECHGQRHYIRISSTSRLLSIWKILTSSGWLALHNLDLKVKGAVERNLNFFP